VLCAEDDEIVLSLTLKIRMLRRGYLRGVLLGTKCLGLRVVCPGRRKGRRPESESDVRGMIQQGQSRKYVDL